MLQSVGSQMISEWIAYALLEPFGQERGDLQAGIMATAIARANGNKKAAPSDFVLTFKPKGSRTQSPQEVEARLNSFFKVMQSQKKVQ